MKDFINNRYVIGADVGGSHLSSAVVDLKDGCLVTDPVSTPVNSCGSALEIIDAWVSNLSATASAWGKPISSAGLAIPGPFDYVNGICKISGVEKFESIFGIDLTPTLSARLREEGITDFRYVNDASAFALGECLGGAARNVSRAVAITLGTGVGSGFVSDHKLVEHGEGVPENGWVYCLPYEDSLVDASFSTRWLCRRFEELTGEKVSGGKEIADRCPADARAVRVFEEFGSLLAKFVVPLLKDFNSNTLVLGGSIALAYPLFGPELERAIVAAGSSIRVHTTELHDKAALIGAASLFLQ